MRKNPDRGVRKIEHEHSQQDRDARRLNWEDVRVFAVCAECRSIRSAAQILKQSPSTIGRKIDRLEELLGVRLFDRVRDGIFITSEGRAFLVGAQRMEHGSYDLIRAKRDKALDRTSVTISITEGLGSYWMMPQLVRFQRQAPDIIVHLRCAMDSVDVMRLEADISIQFNKPTDPESKVVRLGRMHAYPFASRSYLETYGTPKDAADMRHHRLVNQMAPQLDPRAWARHLKMESVEEIVGVSSNASTAVLYGIENGAGIGALPTYVSVINRRIVPVDIGVVHPMDIWLTFRQDLRQSQRRSQFVDWIESMFDPKHHPYFRDEFIHPNDLRRMIPESVY